VKDYDEQSLEQINGTLAFLVASKGIETSIT
jgi:hypothetical protein